MALSYRSSDSSSTSTSELLSKSVSSTTRVKAGRGSTSTVNSRSGSKSISLSSSSSWSFSLSASSIVRACAAIVLLLLCINMFMVLQGQENNKWTFSRLLYVLEGMPDLKLENWRLSTIVADWGYFNFFRDFLNLFVSPINTALFVIGGVATVITFCGYFLGYLFL